MNRLAKVKLRRIDTTHNDDEMQETLYTYDKRGLVKTEVNALGDGKSATFLYNGTNELIGMDDWNGETTFGRDLLNRILYVNDHENRVTQYDYDDIGNKISLGYPDQMQVDYWYDAENQLVEMVDFDDGVFKFAYDANGNLTFKEYPNYETGYYFYNANNRVIELD